MTLIGQNPQDCWFDPVFVEKYMKALPNLSPHVSNLARVADLVHRAKRKEIVFPKTVLAEASGPSMLYRAYEDLKRVIEKKDLAIPRVTDRDISELMLAQGKNPLKAIGNMTGEDSTLGPETFDMVDNGSLPLLRNPEEVHQSLLEAHRILKRGGLLELTLKNKRFLEENEKEEVIGFYSGLEKLGFKVLTNRNEGFTISKDLLNRLKRSRGEHFAESYASKLANTYLIIAQKVDNPTNIRSDNFWFETIHSEDNSVLTSYSNESIKSSDFSRTKKRIKRAKKQNRPRAQITETEDFTHIIDQQGNVISLKKQGRKQDEN